MLQNLKTIFFTLFISVQVWAANSEIHSCAWFDGRGTLTDDYTIAYNKTGNELTSLDVTHRLYWPTQLIYNKKTKALIGDEVQLNAPEFLSFADWKKQNCTQALSVCDSEAYEQAKQAYLKSDRWTLQPHEILSNDPNFEVVLSQITAIQTTHADVKTDGVVGDYKSYVSVKEDTWTNTLYATDIYSNNVPYFISRFFGKLRFLDNPASYSIRINYKASSKDTTYPYISTIGCNKFSGH